MKYMTFNRSCSYAGFANLLEKYDIYYEDYEIAKALSIPYLFLYFQEEDCYKAGAMIQSHQWFNYFSNSVGFDYVEEWHNPQSAIEYFDKNRRSCMLGIIIKTDSNSKHAVIFEDKENEKYRFLNPKRKDSIEPDYYEFDKDELIKKLPPNIVMGYLVKNQKIVPFNITDKLVCSVNNIENYKNKMIEFCSKKQDIKTLIETRDILFSPLLLDVLAMMELIGEASLAIDIKNIRDKYMKAMKETQEVLLTDYIIPEYLNDIILRYKKVISDYIVKYKIDNDNWNKPPLRITKCIRSPPCSGGSDSAKPQSGCALCAFLLHHIFPALQNLRFRLFGLAKRQLLRTLGAILLKWY